MPHQWLCRAVSKAICTEPSAELHRAFTGVSITSGCLLEGSTSADALSLVKSSSHARAGGDAQSIDSEEFLINAHMDKFQDVDGLLLGKYR